jgi:hypothetical protein
VTFALLLVVEGGAGAYPGTFGAAGFLKFGPTAQPAVTSQAAIAMRPRTRDFRVRFIRIDLRLAFHIGSVDHRRAPG